MRLVIFWCSKLEVIDVKFYDLLGVIKSRIEKIANNDKQKDVLALLYISLFTTFLLFILSEFIVEFINIIIKNCPISRELIENINNPSFYKIYFNKLSRLNDNLLSINHIIILLKMSIFLIIVCVYSNYLEKFNFIREFIFMIISISILMILFLNKEIIIFLVLLIFLIILIIPLKSKKYFNLIKKLRYFSFLWSDNINLDKKIVMKSIGKILLIVVICGILSYFTLTYISVYLRFLIYISLVMRIYIGNSSDDKLMDIIKKTSVYFLVIIIYIILNRQLTLKTEKILTLLITLYFSVDRLFSISEDINLLISEKSVLYYYEEENLSVKDLNKIYINLQLIDENIEETSLVIQILLRYRLISNKNTFNCEQLKDEVFKLSALYKSKKYSSYSILIRYINIVINEVLFNYEEFLKERKCLFNDINDSTTQKICPLEAVIDYIYVLNQNKEYKKIINLYDKYLFSYVKNLNNEILVLLIEASNSIGKKGLSEQLENIIRKST